MKWSTMVLAGIASLLPGIGTAVLIGLLNRGIAPSNAATDLGVPYFVMCGVVFCTMLAVNLYLVRRSQGIVHELRVTLARRILATTVRTLEEIGPARLLTALTDDVYTIGEGYRTIPQLCGQAAVLVASFIYLGFLSLPGVAVVLPCVLLGAVAYRALGRGARLVMWRTRAVQDRLAEHLRGLTHGHKELKLSVPRSKDFLDTELAPASAEIRDGNIAADSRFSTAAAVGQVLFLVIVGVLVFGGVPVLRDLSPPVRAAFTLTLLFVQAPLSGALNSLYPIMRSRVARANLHRLGLALERDVELEQSDPGRVTEFGRIELSGVSCSYQRDDGRFTVGPLDLAIAKGELIFVIGGNGSGKSTLGKLLCGLYPLESGCIVVDGKEVDTASLQRYRHHFTTVFSDFFLFESLLGEHDADLDERAGVYLHKLALAEKVKVVAGKLSTTQLSQGQRKRLALLGAYLEDRPIYLFDEWAADQDPVFKAVFYEELLPELKARGKTVVCITHDDRYFSRADRIWKLESGKLVSTSA